MPLSSRITATCLPEPMCPWLWPASLQPAVVAAFFLFCSFTAPAPRPAPVSLLFHPHGSVLHIFAWFTYFVIQISVPLRDRHPCLPPRQWFSISLLCLTCATAPTASATILVFHLFTSFLCSFPSLRGEAQEKPIHLVLH